MTEAWKSIIRFFNKDTLERNSELSDPIPVKLPLSLLEEVTNQAKAIGGDRYRSKHLINLIELGTKFYRVNSDFISSLPLEQVNLITRLHYVFNDLNLESTKVAMSLGHDNAIKVSNWLNGKEIPSFQELETFATKYFINSDWLKLGSKEYQPEFMPYIVIRKSFYSWKEGLKELLDDFNGQKVRGIQIIRSETGSIAFAVGYGSHDEMDTQVRIFDYYNLKLRNRDDIGGGGFSNAVDLAILCLVLYRYIRNQLIISYNIDDDEMKLITSGQKLPKHVGIWGQSKASIWYESIFDPRDTENNSDSSYWKGAKNLFRLIQTDQHFISEKSKLLDDPEKQIQKIIGKSLI
ncbi:hypothetical protein [Acinetobacter soli]|uniref:hypothetical protein n=1 Tax=Acinetobacter soli TaxID=487316 RepID=UPI00125DB9C5|nr:hypothetical protein [Acinetobacter soli]